MPRERQYQAFVIDAAELARHMRLPEDHRIVRIDPAMAGHPSGITVVVEGIGGMICPKGGMVYHHHFYERWRDEELPHYKENALERLGPYEW